MAFRWIQPKHIAKEKHGDSQEVLDRLKEFLSSNTGTFSAMMIAFWKDQQDATTIKEIKDAIQDGQIPQSLIKDIQHDYTFLVREKINDIGRTAMSAGPSGQPIFDGKEFELNMQTPGVLNWINERGAEFITASTAEQKEAIAALLEKKILDEHTVDELAKAIRPCIGLTRSQAKANMKYYDNIVKTLTEEHPRMSKETIQKRALDASNKYANRLLRQRSMTIAQTELAFAYNRGADQGIRQAMESGLLGMCKKVWSTSGDEKMCQTCSALDGMELGIDDSFDFKGKELFAGHKMLPPAHPRCACAIQYVEV